MKKKRKLCLSDSFGKKTTELKKGDFVRCNTNPEKKDYKISIHFGGDELTFEMPYHSCTMMYKNILERKRKFSEKEPFHFRENL